MRLIKPLFKIKEQGPELEGIYKQIEYAGRICYKSSDKITEDSAKEFVDRLIKSGHTSVLEHGTVHLKIPIKFNYLGDLLTSKYKNNPYSKVVMINNIYYVTTNYRVLLQNNWLDDLKYLCEPTEYHKKRICVEFVCDRGISHEFVRHKLLCVA
ncbi:FAD-dependent thymidylate synthase [Intestinibacter sp.]|uniref:FAD-dependent thymidylate synthase n=1 Tax=Intestinibacter sp. TaxID=1965304 RepID=UPI003F169B2A